MTSCARLLVPAVFPNAIYHLRVVHDAATSLPTPADYMPKLSLWNHAHCTYETQQNFIEFPTPNHQTVHRRLNFVLVMKSIPHKKHCPTPVKLPMPGSRQTTYRIPSPNRDCAVQFPAAEEAVRSWIADLTPACPLKGFGVVGVVWRWW